MERDTFAYIGNIVIRGGEDALRGLANPHLSVPEVADLMFTIHGRADIKKEVVRLQQELLVDTDPPLAPKPNKVQLQSELGLNAKGQDVVMLQMALGVHPTGTYDEQTQEAVLTFQKWAIGGGLPKTGTVGPETWDALMWDVPHYSRNVELQARSIGPLPQAAAVASVKAPLNPFAPPSEAIAAATPDDTPYQLSLNGIWNKLTHVLAGTTQQHAPLEPKVTSTRIQPPVGKGDVAPVSDPSRGGPAL